MTGKTIYNSKGIGNIFNSFFVNVGVNIASNISDDDFRHKTFNKINYKCHIKNSIFFSLIDPNEITNMIIKLKDYSSHSEDWLTNSIMKKTSNNLSLPLSIIFNKCFRDGEFPFSFKKSIVIPLYKTNDKSSCVLRHHNNFCNYSKDVLVIVSRMGISSPEK